MAADLIDLGAARFAPRLSDLEAELIDARSAWTARDHQRALDGGIPPCWVDRIGRGYFAFHADGTASHSAREFVETGPCIVVPVFADLTSPTADAADPERTVLGDDIDAQLIDLVLFRPNRPDVFATRLGVAEWIGAVDWQCEISPPVRIWRDPLDWLRANGSGLCLLTRDRIEQYRILSGLNAIEASNEHHAAEIRRALDRPWPTPPSRQPGRRPMPHDDDTPRPFPIAASGDWPHEDLDFGPMPAPAPAPQLVAIDPTTLHGLPVPQRQWLVPDWIPMARATSMYGSGGEGKTLLMQMLTTACALGDKWLGMPVRQCNSLLLFCEDDAAEMHMRLADINEHFGCTLADLGAMRWLPRLGDDNTLMTFVNGRALRTPLYDHLLSAGREHEAQLAVCDTLADVFPGNESDRAQARAFAQTALGHLARELNAAVVALAHPSLVGLANGNSGSGSTAWKGTFRSLLYLESPKGDDGESPDPDIRVLRRAKANYARRDETIEIRWQNGVFVPLYATSGIIASIERKPCDRVFLDLLDKVSAEGRHVTDTNHGSNYAPKIFSMRPDRERFTKREFELAMQRLFAEKKIRIGEYRDALRHSHLCIVKA
jgi:RecA-family ATPase